MKKMLLTPLLFACTLALTQTKPPVAVTTAFSKKFPDASHVKWAKENAKEFQADFELKGRKMTGNFDLVGSWKETKTEIDVVDLPAVVARSIAIKYPGAVILSTDKIEKSDGKIIYVANLEVKALKIEAQVFADGRFVK